MKSSIALLSFCTAFGLGGCNPPAPVVVPVAVPTPVPGPAGPTGATGDTGATGNTGNTGKTGDGSTVIVVTPAASAPTN
jgi:hypothetical protein